MNEKYLLITENAINLPKSFDSELFSELFCNFAMGNKEYKCVASNDTLEITMGDYTQAELTEGEYIINVTENGVYITAKDENALKRGFMTLLEKIKIGKNRELYIECGIYKGCPKMNFRSVHYCVFPETKLYFLRKCIRTSAMLKYTHIVIEFWGSLKYDCLNELSWENSYSKEEIKPILDEARMLGLEIIPMFNILGHSSASRHGKGKHVVLDQNLSYEYMFVNNGWVWNFEDDEVYNLLKNVRKELCDLCGEGSYFHIGCDEAYLMNFDDDFYYKTVDYINRVQEELSKDGRRAIMWGDMLLYKPDFPDMGNCNAETKKRGEIFTKGISKNIIIADWHYWVKTPIWTTSQYFKEEGFDVLCCPWEDRENAVNAVNTVAKNDLFGIMETTWHTLYDCFYTMAYIGLASYENREDVIKNDFLNIKDYAAMLARKAYHPKGNYENAGWSAAQIGEGV